MRLDPLPPDVDAVMPLPVAADSAEAKAASADLQRLTARVEAMRAELTRLLQDVVVAETRLDGSQASRLLAANEELVVAAMRNQVEADTSAQALVELSLTAERDPLTRLPNRVLLLDRMASAIAKARRSKSSLAVLFVDLNHFKQINDTLGHAAGDKVLQRASQCLLDAIREVDTVSRHGGDEFIILLPEVATKADAVRVADKALAALAVPTHFGEQVLRLSASIGISLYPQHGRDGSALIDRADTAMYRAKKAGMGHCVYGSPLALVDPGIERRLRSIRQPLTEFETAVAEHDQRYAHLQEANEQLALAAVNARDLQQAAERSQRQQSEALARVAHELRNPLAPIRFAADLLGHVRTDEPLLPRARAIIERQTEQLARVIDDVIAVSRGHVGQLEVAFCEIDLVDVIDDAIDATRTAMDGRRQSLDVTVPSCPLKIFGDRVRLVQIVGNLFDNASKNTPACGRIALKAAVCGDAIVFSVTDDGIGIEADVLPCILEPFVQEAPALPSGGGADAGLGLTVTRELVLAHGGSIVARSGGRGAGSEFTVSLPAARKSPPADTVVPQNTQG